MTRRSDAARTAPMVGYRGRLPWITYRGKCRTCSHFATIEQPHTGGFCAACREFGDTVILARMWADQKHQERRIRELRDTSPEILLSGDKFEIVTGKIAVLLDDPRVKYRELAGRALANVLRYKAEADQVGPKEGSLCGKV